MTLGKTEKRVVVIKLSLCPTEALRIMEDAMHEELPPAVYCRKAVRWYGEFMRSNSSRLAAGSNVNVSTSELLDDPSDSGFGLLTGAED